jgi:hypothetical protein
MHIVRGSAHFLNFPAYILIYNYKKYYYEGWIVHTFVEFFGLNPKTLLLWLVSTQPTSLKIEIML